MQKFSETIAFKRSDNSLAVFSGATATIYNAGTMVLATLYADDEIATVTNPLTANSNGIVECKLANGSYDITYSNGSSSQTVTGIVVVDPANVAITGGTIDGVTIGGIEPPDATLNDLTVEGQFNN